MFVLTQADLCRDALVKREQVRAVVGAFPIILSNADDGLGVEEMRRMITPELTAVLIGSRPPGNRRW